MPRKRVQFLDADKNLVNTQIHPDTAEIKRGEFCKLIGNGINVRLFLTIQDDKLLYTHSGPEEHDFSRTLSISLATLIQNHHLTSKMKVTLAYILAQSVWQFYDSAWMKTPFTSETIRFVRERSSQFIFNEFEVFPSRPYFSVQFGDAGPDTEKSSDRLFEIHRYPQVRSLGTMLVEIGCGRLLSESEDGSRGGSETAKINKDWERANAASREEAVWDGFDYSTYRTAVKNCLDPKIFDRAASEPGSTTSERAAQLKLHREILYERVVVPLEELLTGTGWIVGFPDNRPATESLAPARGHKDAEAWLDRVCSLQRELAFHASLENRVKIAILDTGYDPEAFTRFRRNRLKGWKDYIEDVTEPQDDDGHGTHIASLIMTIAPTADIYVARVARGGKDVGNIRENVAEVSFTRSKHEQISFDRQLELN
jgi:hypothetical protein